MHLTRKFSVCCFHSFSLCLLLYSFSSLLFIQLSYTGTSSFVGSSLALFLDRIANTVKLVLNGRLVYIVLDLYSIFM